MALQTSDFDYELPPELIAQTPPARRGDSRLLVVRRTGGQPGGRADGRTGSGTPFPLEDRRFGDLLDLIPAGDVLVLNTTKVRHARLLGRRPSGAPAEVLLIHPAENGTWVAMGTPGSALRPGRRIFVGVVAPIDPRVETPEEVRDRTLEAAEFIPVDQLGTTDDCGFAPFSDDISTSWSPCWSAWSTKRSRHCRRRIAPASSSS